ncbi:hypothetical protein G6F55_011784 [Rhizopus delemar]|uniref:Uncharacterized protein n=2 Tax=Rhizopus TaxID=4842 RepID=A0A9P7CIU2_9FUNG|nr:hypothetical protein G6F55_011784 [Rhizopus delemar]KAG1534242.1 hypothetical protein G6F51_012205 [Rhizopus arrhizus]KAG1488669.1 hypothetical protein G6F54_011951 [Rhizopus delemar]KAG1497179.1 hypothetical protein G6F53_012025 [Rhizopus delemar]KAG1519855.1 hypothetical protein G6F52_008217 [Rhizopus delemar]
MPNNENNQLEQLEEDAQDSIRRGVIYDRQFVAYQFEYNSKLRSLDMKEQLVELNNDVARSALDSAPGSEQQNIEKEDNSVATVIKRKALEYREKYHSLEINEKGVVSLGLNSILDVSFNFPDCQSKLFTNQEWLELRKQYRPVGYNTTEYGRIRSILQPVFQAYRQNKTFDNNWVKMYKEAKKLEKHYDPVFSPKHADIAFCIFFVMQVLSIIRYNPGLFDTAIDSSEWDFVVKFWGPITERLFQDSELRLKWGDTNLTLNDTVSETALKVDLRVANDKMKQRYNAEHDVAVLEAAEENAGNAKFIFDRFKISIENKVIIDNYLLDGALLSSVNSLQVSGLGIHFLNTTLEEPGFIAFIVFPGRLCLKKQYLQ